MAGILYLDQIFQGVKNGAIETDRMDQIPKGLGSLYFIQFSHRFNSKMASYDNNLKPLLRLALASPGPLPEKLTCAALTWDTEHYRRQRIQLGAFLHDSPEGIGLFHKSLAEWLSSPESSPFYVDKDIGSKQLGNFLWSTSKNPTRISPTAARLPINSVGESERGAVPGFLSQAPSTGLVISETAIRDSAAGSARP